MGNKSNTNHYMNKRNTNKVPKIKTETVREMYQELEIINFRAFNEFKISNLGKINIFFGPNNCGKTSILEAVFTHACGLNITPFISRIVFERGGDKINGFLDYGDRILSIFKDTTKSPYSAQINAKLTNGKLYKSKFSFSPSGNLSELDPINIGQFSSDFLSENNQGVFEFMGDSIPSVFLGKWEIIQNNTSQSYDLNFPTKDVSLFSPFKLGYFADILSHRKSSEVIKIFGQLKRQNMLNDFVAELRKAFPIIVDLDLIPYSYGKIGAIYAKTEDNRNLPLYSYGDGLRRWYYILGNMALYNNGVHCIEEIDATFHPSAQQDFSKLLIKYSEKFNNQLFVSSHSIEFADAFLNSVYGDDSEFKFDDKNDPIRFYTLRPPSASNGYQSEVWSYTGLEAYKKRRDFDLG